MSNEFSHSSIEQVAQDLRAAYGGRPIAPVRDRVPSIDVAYAAQESNTRHWLSSGRTLVGRKIGLTSKAVQKQLGVDQPDFGMLFADMAVLDDDEIPVGKLIQPKAEAEIAFVLGVDLDRRGLTVADVVSAVAYALPAIEVVDSRIADWKISILDTVADNASSGLFVLGCTPVPLTALDLRAVTMEMTQGGGVVSRGSGAACLGNPLHATLWLAEKMVEVGRPLRAGDIVLAGALGPMVAARPGDRFEATFGGLGSVRVSFAAA